MPSRTASTSTATFRVDNDPPGWLTARPYPRTGRMSPIRRMCPDGGIGRRTVFRWRRGQPRGGSSPLLGTNSLKSLNKSSQARSRERVCYDSLLRFGAHSSNLSIGKTVTNGPRGCYGFSHGFVPRGMTLRNGRYYLRRHIPSDIQPIIRRSEVWRSLKTDSLQTALRRFPLVTSVLESQFERIRADAGLSVDPTLLRPCGAGGLSP